MKSSRYAVVIAAAGQSRRFRAQSTNFESALDKKPFVSLKGRAVWLYSAERFARRSDVAQILLVVSPEDVEEVNQRYSGELAFYGVQIIPGGAERFLSVENALKAVAADVDYIAVHDAARPCVSDEEIERVFSECARSGAAILATRVVASLKRAQSTCAPDERGLRGASYRGEERCVVAESVARDMLWEALTPQVFRRELLDKAYRERPKDFLPTDDCGLVERLGTSVSIVEGSRLNIKITNREDLSIAEKFLDLLGKRGNDKDFRLGRKR